MVKANRGQMTGCGDPKSNAPIVSVCLAADRHEYATPTILLQAGRLAERFKLSGQLATAIAELAFRVEAQR